MPYTPIARQTTMVRRILRVFRSATPEQVLVGYYWYADAHRLAEDLAIEHEYSLEVTAGVIAALSPLMSWTGNVAIATRAIENRSIRGGALGANVNKAERILQGEKISDVLGTENAKTGHKVRAFYRSILTAGRDPYAVCIDRHAAGIALNTRDVTTLSITDRRYRDIADAYRRATAILNRSRATLPMLTPAQVQAITWVTWRARYWAEGAFDPKGDIDRGPERPSQLETDREIALREHYRDTASDRG